MFCRIRTIPAIFVILVLFVSLAASGDFVSTWKAPDSAPMYLAGKKVAVLVLSKDRASRIAAEQMLAKDITARGATGVSARELIPESELADRDKAKSRLQEAGVSAIVVIQPTPQGHVKLDPHQSFWKSYSTDAQSGSNGKDVKIYVETKVYSLEQDQLVWIGTSVTKTSDVVKFINNLTKSVGAQLQKQGLLQKKKST